jgi:hypothetical protein
MFCNMRVIYPTKLSACRYGILNCNRIFLSDIGEIIGLTNHNRTKLIVFFFFFFLNNM